MSPRLKLTIGNRTLFLCLLVVTIIRNQKQMQILQDLFCMIEPLFFFYNSFLWRLYISYCPSGGHSFVGLT